MTKSICVVGLGYIGLPTAVMFGLGPLYMILVLNRFNRSDARKKERINTFLINITIALDFLLVRTRMKECVCLLQSLHVTGANAYC